MFEDLKGKAIVVTGASSGIGWFTVEQLCLVGAKVTAVARNPQKLSELSEMTGCHVIVADLANVAGIEIVDAELGRVDGLVNCAGLAILEPCVDVTDSAFDQQMAINARATAMMSKLVARRMIAQQQGGAIVNVSSQASLASLTDHLSYSASKGAMDAMTRVMCAEWGSHNIRVNSVNPTVTLTPMAKVGWSDPQKAAAMTSRIPLGRFAEPLEVVQPIMFLLSSAASMISGVTLPIDGGFVAG
ncbi:2-dehydro-3-deoxy-D-gluconate 5-dehydrogenase [Marinomonas gallaica]|uniref:2-dehydro-3-deoxy-D-gluconate 5-dehydrogenase n=1 Tax=Marinomonas gallaica TaxID=1806667 RepID=A0A1C3JUC5_9GAMM|nr:SDR family oxidoreductase [Marinomonas gallaica]SBT18669.1 2-dehydro-3-deoxy-D-gluconate 5-dehydrogenase [Marinomonas gallaica]SBT21624.1 2-dehydro-3-deoxy-D-gluconate 5-dehydrogenase [Marinomonas gallaica]